MSPGLSSSHKDLWTILENCLSRCRNIEVANDIRPGIKSTCVTAPGWEWGVIFTSYPYLSQTTSFSQWNSFTLFSQGYKTRVGWGYLFWSWMNSEHPKRNLIFGSIQDFSTNWLYPMVLWDHLNIHCFLPKLALFEFYSLLYFLKCEYMTGAGGLCGETWKVRKRSEAVETWAAHLSIKRNLSVEIWPS